VYEVANGGEDILENNVVVDKAGSFTQLAGELLYRFGSQEKYYLGGRYNTVNGKTRESAVDEMRINRYNIGGGWFLTKNVLAKVEYVEQRYTGEAWTGRFKGAEFSGLVIEAVIGF
jgi:hypothetical protein